MEDLNIIELYWQRDQRAISETETKYGAFCRGIAMNILHIIEDAEECVNDTWLAAWNGMPPARPSHLRAWLGKIVRNISLSLWDKNHAMKRYQGIDEMFDELAECLPSNETVEDAIEEKTLTEAIEVWLLKQSEEKRALFIRRYFEGMPVSELAKVWKKKPQELSQILFRLRKSLKAHLQSEGIYI